MRHIIEILHDSAKATVARNALAAKFRDLRNDPALANCSAGFRRWARQDMLAQCQRAPSNQHPVRLRSRAARLCRYANRLDREPAHHLPCGLQDARWYEIEGARIAARECSRLADYLSLGN